MSSTDQDAELERGSELASMSAPLVVVVRPPSIKLPKHMQHYTSATSPAESTPVSPLSDSDSEGYRTELDFDECEAALQEVACAPVQLQELLVDVDDLLPPSERAGQELAQGYSLKDLVRNARGVSRRSSKLGRLSWPFLFFLVVAVLLIVLARGHLLLILSWLAQLPWLERMAVFIALFTLVSFPFGFGYIILNMMAGYLYGFVCGQAVVMLSVAVGFSIAFLSCRFWLRNYAQRSITSQALRAVMRVVEGPHGIKVIFLTRLTPIPFGLQNVLFSVSSACVVWVCICEGIDNWRVNEWVCDWWLRLVC